VLYRATGRYAAAESLLLQSVEISRRTLGEEDPNVAQGLDNLAGLYEQMGDYAAADKVLTSLAEGGINAKAAAIAHPDMDEEPEEPVGGGAAKRKGGTRSK
jgi:hypothetical protein